MSYKVGDRTTILQKMKEYFEERYVALDVEIRFLNRRLIVDKGNMGAINQAITKSKQEQKILEDKLDIVKDELSKT